MRQVYVHRRNEQHMRDSAAAGTGGGGGDGTAGSAAAAAATAGGSLTGGRGKAGRSRLFELNLMVSLVRVVV